MIEKKKGFWETGRDDSTELVQLRRVLSVRLDSPWGGNGDLSVYSFQLRGSAEGVTIRKQEEMWDLMGLGSVGKSLTKKSTMVADLKQMGFLKEGRRKKKVKPVILVWRVLSSAKEGKAMPKGMCNKQSVKVTVQRTVLKASREILG